MATIDTPVIINGFIYAIKYDWEDKYDFHFSTSEKMEDNGYLMLGTHTILHTIPADFDVVAAEMSALRKSKTKAVEAFQAEMDRVNKRITQLLALSAPTTSNGMEILDAEDREAAADAGYSDDIPF